MLWDFVGNLEFVSGSEHEKGAAAFGMRAGNFRLEENARNSHSIPSLFPLSFVITYFYGCLPSILLFLQLLALVDEVSVDTVTRGALKDDATFKGVRDVIKKGNRVLEEMLVRRERKYTLFFRLVQEHDVEQIDRMKNWNAKVEKAVNNVTGGQSRDAYTSSQAASSSGEESSDTASISTIGSQSTGSVSGRVGVFSRGRQLLPAAGRVRARRATPDAAPPQVQTRHGERRRFGRGRIFGRDEQQQRLVVVGDEQ